MSEETKLILEAIQGIQTDLKEVKADVQGLKADV